METRQIMVRSTSQRGHGVDLPDVTLNHDVVSPKVEKAMYAASAQLKRVGVRHALIGGLAVGAHGAPYATKDVDFLVGEEAFEHHGGGIVTIAPGVPIQANDIVVDPVSIGSEDEYLRDVWSNLELSDGIPVVPIEVLVAMKLRAGRSKDMTAVVELLKVGIDVERVRDYLEEHSLDAAARRFETAIRTAAAEDE